MENTPNGKSLLGQNLVRYIKKLFAYEYLSTYICIQPIHMKFCAYENFRDEHL